MRDASRVILVEEAAELTEETASARSTSTSVGDDAGGDGGHFSARVGRWLVGALSTRRFHGTLLAVGLHRAPRWFALTACTAKM